MKRFNELFGLSPFTDSDRAEQDDGRLCHYECTIVTSAGGRGCDRISSGRHSAA
jgi:hypothetical protein